MSLNSLLGLGGNKSDVYVSVSPACGLEVIELEGNGTVKSYAQAPLVYNEAQREIADYDKFKDTLVDLLASRNIAPNKANIHLNLPTVWFGLKEGVRLMLDDSAVESIVLGELEQAYIFKRKNPVARWFDAMVSTNTDSRSVFYTGLQEEVIITLKECISSLGANLVSIGSSMFSDLKGLYVTGIARDLMDNPDLSWNLMIVNDSGFKMIGLQGKRLLEYYEEPMPIKTFDTEQVYSEIEQNVQIALMSSPATSLVIVSESNLVSAQILAERLQFGGQTIVVEDNQFRKEPLFDFGLNVLPEDQLKLSLNAIGAVAPAGYIENDIDFIGGTVEVVPVVMGMTPQVATIVSLGVLLVVAAISYFISFYSQKMYDDEQAKITELDSQIQNIDTQIAQLSGEASASFNAEDEIEKTLKNNRIKLMAYTSLGVSIPKNVYITYFITGDNGLIDIRGCSNSVEEVYVFFKNLKDSMIESNLRLGKLDLKSDDSLDTLVNSTVSAIDNAPYVFEITNMDESQLKSFIGRGGDQKSDEQNKADGDQAKDNQSQKQ